MSLPSFPRAQVFPRRLTANDTLPDSLRFETDEVSYDGAHYGDFARCPQAAANLYFNIDRLQMTGTFAVGGQVLTLNQTVSRSGDLFLASAFSSDDDTGDSIFMSVRIRADILLSTPSGIVGSCTVSGSASIYDEETETTELTEYQSILPNENVTLFGIPIASPYTQFNPDQVSSAMSLAITDATAPT